MLAARLTLTSEVLTVRVKLPLIVSASTVMEPVMLTLKPAATLPKVPKLTVLPVLFSSKRAEVTAREKPNPPGMFAVKDMSSTPTKPALVIWNPPLAEKPRRSVLPALTVNWPLNVTVISEPTFSKRKEPRPPITLATLTLTEAKRRTVLAATLTWTVEPVGRLSVPIAIRETFPALLVVLISRKNRPLNWMADPRVAEAFNSTLARTPADDIAKVPAAEREPSGCTLRDMLKSSRKVRPLTVSVALISNAPTRSNLPPSEMVPAPNT